MSGIPNPLSTTLRRLPVERAIQHNWSQTFTFWYSNVFCLCMMWGYKCLYRDYILNCDFLAQVQFYLLTPTPTRIFLLILRGSKSSICISRSQDANTTSSVLTKYSASHLIGW